jgi:magnesium-transporting ATPase (P-type)
LAVLPLTDPRVKPSDKKAASFAWRLFFRWLAFIGYISAALFLCASFFDAAFFDAALLGLKLRIRMRALPPFCHPMNHDESRN